MALKSLDVVVALALVRPDHPASYAELAKAVGLSASEAHQSLRRLRDAGLVAPSFRTLRDARVNRRALIEFLEHGVRFAYFVVPGPVVRGVPTAHSSPPLDRLLQASSDSTLVWPDPEGRARGQALEPLHRSVPAIARRDPRLYELLTLVDAIRCGTVRERGLAISELRKRLAHEPAA